MHHAQKRVLIAGAGIGGLTAAIALKQAGYDVHVLEQADQIRAIGAGISLQMNATAALDRVGLYDTIRDAGNIITQAQICGPDGSAFSGVPFQRIADQVGFSFISIHRGRLQAILLDALGEEHVTTGVEVDHIEEQGEIVRVRRPDGTFEVADFLVGADGINSNVRKYLWGDQPKRYTGYAAWRGICPNPPATEKSVFVEVWGDQQVFGHVAINEEQRYWFATKLTPAGRSDAGDPHEEILKRFGHLPEPVSTLIESTMPEHLLRNDIYDRPPISRWGRDRITLLGDAAHPMTPNMGQGGGQAVEDAIILAHTLSNGQDVTTSLRNYETRRHPRTKQFVNQSRMFTALAHGHPLWARIARASVFRWMPEAIKIHQMQQLYRFEL